MKKLYLAVSGIFAVIPGFAIMWKGIATPPGSGYSFLFGGVIEAFGSLALILLWMYQVKIKNFKPLTIFKSSIALGVTSFIFIILYIILYNHCIVTHEPNDAMVFFPLWTSGELEKLVAKAGGRWAALERYGYYSVYSAALSMPSYVLSLTVGILLFCYQSIFTSLTIAFGLVGLHKGKTINIEKEPLKEKG